jgi:hypothetical protein
MGIAVNVLDVIKLNFFASFGRRLPGLEQFQNIG